MKCTKHVLIIFLFEKVRSCLASIRATKVNDKSRGKSLSNRTSTISSKSSNLDRMAEEAIVKVLDDPPSGSENWKVGNKRDRKTVEALFRGNSVTDVCLDERDFEMTVEGFRDRPLDDGDDTVGSEGDSRKTMLEDHSSRLGKRAMSLSSYFTVLDWDLGIKWPFTQAHSIQARKLKLT